MVPLFSLGLAGVTYAALLPLLFLPVFALLFIPSMLVPGARASEVGKAAYCYVLMAAGIVLMSVSGLPALYSVLEKLLLGGDRLSTEAYIALLILFATGGLTFLRHESMALRIEEPSRRVCSSLFWFLWKMVGFVLMAGSILSLVFTMLFAKESFAGAWWIMPFLMLLYGTLLSWVTREQVKKKVVKAIGKKKAVATV